MNKPDDSEIPLSMAQRIDSACDAFESAWIAGQRPDINEFVLAAAAGDRDQLLRELAALDVAYRRRTGEKPSVADYTSRFPELDVTWLAAILDDSGNQPTLGLHSAASATLGTIRYFGDYELLEEIARGGMGVVFKARQL